MILFGDWRLTLLCIVAATVLFGGAGKKADTSAAPSGDTQRPHGNGFYVGCG